MNNKEFISALADKVGRTQDETQKLVKTALQAMGDNFESFHWITNACTP